MSAGGVGGGAAAGAPAGVTHIVLFHYRDATTPKQVAEVARRFRALALTERHGAPYILSITDGAQNSPENAGHGFEHAFVVEFASLDDRRYYVGQPFVSDGEPFDRAHDDFKGWVAPLLADVLVFDFAR
jgi:Stress responsive A/B Barrel Domain